MRKLCVCMALCLGLLFGNGAAAAAAGPLVVNGKNLPAGSEARVYGNTTYVSLRAVAEALEPAAAVAWAGDRATVRANGITLEAIPGRTYIEANGMALPVPGGVRLEGGRTLVPVRVLGKALGADVDWDAGTGTVTVTSGGAPLASGDAFYDADALYWLSRIISAESQGEPLSGKIAVGNVILNRAADREFPDTIYGVIFDDRWGGQFEPVRNGTVYAAPTGESVLAAKLVLEGADVAGESLYFLAPTLTNNHWIMENRDYIMTIGVHWFYK